MNSENRNCKNCKTDFIIEPDDFGFYEKMKVPAPTNCPECRQRFRILHRNFKTLYKRKSDKSGNMIVSMYSGDVKFPVYTNEEWWSDSWEPMSFGKDFDFSRPFFEQLAELFNAVPHLALMQTKSENCDYANVAYGSQNCYLMFGCIEDEDCDYGYMVWHSRESVDNIFLYKCESCYECTDCLESTKLFYSEECESCIDSVGLFDCRNCLNCIGCVGQVNKSYYIFNQSVTKEEYKDFLLKYPLSEKSSIDYILKERDALRSKVPQRSFLGSHNNKVSGNHIYNSHNILNSFDIKGGENSRYCFILAKAVDCYDCSYNGTSIEESYQTLACLGSSRTIGSELAVDSHDIFYSSNCYSSNNLFGCYGLRKKSYCIFNKQYSKEEYEILVPKIIEHMKKNGEWGNFFPVFMSPFAYNESIVNEHMPLTKEEALAKGFLWKDNIPSTKGQGTIEFSKLPKNPEDYSDDLLKEVLTCDSCEKNFKLINREIVFYKKNKLSLPAKCFNCRHQNRMDKRNSFNLWDAKCAKCSKDISTSYNLEDQKKYPLYCEQCYQQEMY